MKNEEAIKIFNTVLFVGKCDAPKEELEECLKMAIKALEQQTCEDCISRQAVDDAIYDYSRACDVDYAQIMEYIDKLPSVTPKTKINILDKIKAEIEQEKIGYPPSADEYKTINKVLDIIDKYKVESEDKE